MKVLKCCREMKEHLVNDNKIFQPWLTWETHPFQAFAEDLNDYLGRILYLAPVDHFDLLPNQGEAHLADGVLHIPNISEQYDTFHTAYLQ